MASSSFPNKLKSKLGKIARSPQGLFFMVLVCFLEPIFLPIIPEFFVSPILIARRHEPVKIMLCALLGTLFGALLTYGLGYCLGKALISWLASFSWLERFCIEDLYYSGLGYLDKYGTFLPFVISLTPLPLKMVTWTCGVARFNVVVYSVGIISGRLIRYSAIFLLPSNKGSQARESALEVPSLLPSSSPKGI